VVVRNELSERAGTEELQLIPFLATEHIAPRHRESLATTESVAGKFFNDPRVHFMRNVLAHAGKSGRRVVSAFIATAFAQEDAEAARAQWRRVADQLRPKLPRLAAFLDEAEADVLAYMNGAEPVERKAGTKGNADKQSTCRRCQGAVGLHHPARSDTAASPRR
jgi:hypothetical protein